MHKRMRRGKEMYPSFDTRRVLCKQHRPYCVKPMRARLKPSNASNAASILRGQKTGQENCGRPKNTVLTLVDTKTSAEGQSINAWNAMSPLAFALLIQPDWQTEQRALYATGESTTDLKPSRNRHTKSRLRSAQSEHGKNGRSRSRLHGEGTRRLRLGQSILWRFGSSLDWPIIVITKTASSARASAHAEHGKNAKTIHNGAKTGEHCGLNTEPSTRIGWQKQEKGGWKTIQKNGWSANAGNGAIPCSEPYETFAKGYGRHCEASAAVRRSSGANV